MTKSNTFLAITISVIGGLFIGYALGVIIRWPTSIDKVTGRDADEQLAINRLIADTKSVSNPANNYRVLLNNLMAEYTVLILDDAATIAAGQSINDQPVSDITQTLITALTEPYGRATPAAALSAWRIQSDAIRSYTKNRLDKNSAGVTSADSQLNLYISQLAAALEKDNPSIKANAIRSTATSYIESIRAAADALVDKDQTKFIAQQHQAITRIGAFADMISKLTVAGLPNRF